MPDMEHRSHNSAPADKRSPRSTPSRPSTRRSAVFTRKPASLDAKKPYGTRGDKPTGSQKSFGARPDFVRTPGTHAPRISSDSRVKSHYARTPRIGEASERRAYGSRAAEKPRYERKTEMHERGEKPSYGARFERPSYGAKKEYGAKSSFEKKPGSYGYKESGSSTRPHTKSIPHARTQSWSQSSDIKPKEKERETTPTTSWGKVANWYDDHLTSDDTYHKKVLLPNILRLVDAQKDETIVDIACGQGFFTQALKGKGVNLIGVDISEELIAIARKNSPDITYHVGSAEDLSMIPDHSANKVLIVLAIQNIEHTQKLCGEVARILKAGGTFHIVMNHPAFRIPKQSSWEYDDKKKVQFRRVDQYIADSRTAIDMHPGMKNSPQTLTFHRPLQYYFKLLSKAGFAVDKLEEWISHKESDSGPRALAENRARKEIPLFLYLRAIKQ